VAADGDGPQVPASGTCRLPCRRRTTSRSRPSATRPTLPWRELPHAIDENDLMRLRAGDEVEKVFVVPT
jgi:hypothetical protein